ncbi:MAG: SDR family oxidoreductase [Candidatus Marinimicrobia bacterium]|nr:SDR family oxidoreductase [Candidatus Neomarinimicrobiota bacterium]
MEFEGKIFLITGGSQGIGASIVDVFLNQGAIVNVMDISIPSDPGLSQSNSLNYYAGDVSKSTDVKEVVAKILDKFGRIDALVNNAGIIRDNVIWKMSEPDFDSVISVNLKGPWLMCKEVAPVMRQQKFGRIVNIVSRAWLGNVGQSNYSSSKGGLVSMTRVLALELARDNITVNAVAPGLIDTPMTRKLDPEVFRKLESALPGKKAGSPENIAHTVAFLASDRARFINGQVIHVDGGRSIGGTAL